MNPEWILLREHIFQAVAEIFLCNGVNSEAVLFTRKTLFDFD